MVGALEVTQSGERMRHGLWGGGTEVYREIEEEERRIKGETG